jgi:hypothetical protein
MFIFELGPHRESDKIMKCCKMSREPGKKQTGAVRWTLWNKLQSDLVVQDSGDTPKSRLLTCATPVGKGPHGPKLDNSAAVRTPRFTTVHPAHRRN